VIVVTGPENVADGTVAMHAGRDDHLGTRLDPAGHAPPGRSVRGHRPPAAARAFHAGRRDRAAEPPRVRADRRASPADGRSRPPARGLPVRPDRRASAAPSRRAAPTKEQRWRGTPPPWCSRLCETRTCRPGSAPTRSASC
jgi:hypothetical protein